MNSSYAPVGRTLRQDSSVSAVLSKVHGKLLRFATVGGTRRIQIVIQLLLWVLLQPLAVVLYVVLRFAFGPFYIASAPAGRISKMVGYIDLWLRRLPQEGPKKRFTIVINTVACPNEQLSEMYGRHVWLLDEKSPLLRRLFTVVHGILLRARWPVAVKLEHGQTVEGEPVLCFTTEEHERGEKLLKDLGIPEGCAYICFGVREDAYYNSYYRKWIPSYATNPFDKNLKVSLENYVPMAARCADSGIYVLRMGQMVDRPLPPGLNAKIIDYATNCRTPFGDVYLLAHCKFTVTGATGIWSIPTAFNRPVVYADQYLLWGTMRPDDLFISAKLWWISEKRFLTFREMLSVGPLYIDERRCLRDGVEVVHNTPEEITAVVLEMNQCLDGTWQPADQDEELQGRFKSLYPPRDKPPDMDKGVDFFGPTTRIVGRIGADFLRTYEYLLD